VVPMSRSLISRRASERDTKPWSALRRAQNTVEEVQAASALAADQSHIVETCGQRSAAPGLRPGDGHAAHDQRRRRERARPRERG
jgi:hypothetical protein